MRRNLQKAASNITLYRSILSALRDKAKLLGDEDPALDIKNNIPLVVALRQQTLELGIGVADEDKG
jgi:hypothetical protein